MIAWIGVVASADYERNLFFKSGSAGSLEQGQRAYHCEKCSYHSRSLFCRIFCFGTLMEDEAELARNSEALLVIALFRGFTRLTKPVRNDFKEQEQLSIAKQWVNTLWRLRLKHF